MTASDLGSGGLLNPAEVEASARKGKLGELVVSLIAVAAGFQVDSRDLQRDGIDLTIRSRTSPYPMLDFQVKCTENEGQDPTQIVYPLDATLYQQLRAESLAPRFLAILVVPSLARDWVRQNPQKLTIRRCCYWLRMSGLPESQNQTSVTLRVPRENRMTGEALSALMHEARVRAQLR